MQAYAEGWELLETAELTDNVTEVFRSWREGTVIRSWLLDLMVAALDDDPGLRQIAGYAEDSGEGRWTVEAGIEHAVATPGDHRGALRPVRLPPGRLADHEGGRRDAQPVRRPRGPDRGPQGRRRLRRGHRPLPTSRVRPSRPAPARVARRARARSHVHVAHLTLHNFRSYADLDVELGPGATAFIGPQRPGQDQPRRGDRLPLAARRRTGSPRTPPWSGPAPTRRSSGPRSSRDGRTAVLEVELNPGRANRARINKSPAAPAPRDHRPGAHRGLRPRRPDPGQGRPERPAQVPRRPADPARPPARRRALRLRPGAQAAQHPAQDRRDRPRRGPRDRAVDARRVGRPPRAGSAPSCSPPGCDSSTTCAPTSASPTRRWPEGRAATTPRSTTSRPSTSTAPPTPPT